MSELEAYIREIEKDVNNYEDTRWGLIGLSHELRWDSNSRTLIEGSDYRIARRLTTSVNNRINPQTDVTPDLLVQLDPKFGVLAEAKISLPVNREYWGEMLEQLEKYDDDLLGWLTSDERVDRNDLVLLIHTFSAVDAADYIKEKIEGGDIILDRNFSVIEFSNIERRDHFLRLRKVYGELSDGNKDSDLHRGKNIPMLLLMKEPDYRRIRLYEKEPPEPIMMQIVMETIHGIPREEDYMVARTNGLHEVEVVGTELCERIRKEDFSGYSQEERQPTIPKIDWVRGALENFVRLNWARRDKKVPGKYIFEIKQRRKPFKQFVRLWAEKRVRAEEHKKKEERKSKTEQIPLFKGQIVSTG